MTHKQGATEEKRIYFRGAKINATQLSQKKELKFYYILA